MNTQYKICSKCKKKLTISEFYKCASKASGYRSECKSCSLTTGDQEKKRLRMHTYYKNNKHKRLKDSIGSLQCKICDFKTGSNIGLATHLHQHNISLLDYLIKYDNLRIPKCPYCGENVKHFKSLKFAKTCGKEDCIAKIKHNMTHSTETKAKLRQARFNYLEKKLGQTAWERRSQGKMSMLEEWFYDNAIIKFDLLSKYDIVNELPVFPYFIDFAFTGIKLAVELDGQSHFKNGTQRYEHDIKKDKFLTDNGWVIYRIGYYEKNDDKLNEFMDFINNFETHQKILPNHLVKGIIIKEKLSKEQREKINKDRSRLRQLAKNKDKIALVVHSNIDFSQFGWGQKVALLIGIPRPKATQWLRTFMPCTYSMAYKTKRAL